MGLARTLARRQLLEARATWPLEEKGKEATAAAVAAGPPALKVASGSAGTKPPPCAAAAASAASKPPNESAGLGSFVVAIAATAQVAILLAACLGDQASYESVVDVSHWVFGITIALACVLGSHEATLAYVVTILALTVLARCTRRSRGDIPCPFVAAAPSSIPDFGEYPVDAYFMAMLVIAAARSVEYTSSTI